jgi:hypothetical protein
MKSGTSELSQQGQSQQNSQGLLSLKLESSHASASYAYCKVNIFIDDINDNAPVARISPVARFSAKKSTETSDGATTHLLVDEHTAANQILAYVAVFDADAGENGTVKSIDLALSSCQTTPDKRSRQRAAKLEQLRLAGLEHLIPSKFTKSVRAR